MSSAEALAYFDQEAETVIITDASPVGLGAILLQEQRGVRKVVAYASRCLTDVERRYSQTEKEALSVVWACERFHVYLYGIQFKVLSDHKPLEVIYSKAHKPSARIERWVLRLQPYDFTVEYLPGPKNIADTLSRLVHGKAGSKPNVADQYIRFIAENAAPKAIPIQEIEKESASDQDMLSVRIAVQTGELDQLPKEYQTVSRELTVLGKLVLRGSRIVIPQELRARVLHLAHEGHQGVVKTKQRLRTKVWWPGIDQDAERRCKTCHGCQLVSQVPHPEPVKRTLLPEQAWQDVAADLLGPLPGGEYLFVIVDYFSRFFEVDVLKSVTSKDIIESLDRIFSTHGIPHSIRTDNGPQFISTQFEEFLRSNDVRHTTSTPLWPQANGQVERQNRSLLKAMRIAQATGKDWRKELNKFLLAYRSTPHTTTGVSPAKLLFGREIRTKIPCIECRRGGDVDVAERDAAMKQKGKIYADEQRLSRSSLLEPGDIVLVKNSKPKNKLSTTFGDELFRVTDKKGSEVTVESPEGVSYRRNSSHVKKYHQGEEQEQRHDEMVPAKTDQRDKGDDGVSQQPGTDTEMNRPRRERRPPERFDEYLLYN